LIKGMKKIKEGNLEYRLQDGKSKEFALIAETFNDMAEQIENLKINVYEEHIKSQRAEIKHLQLQIHPHFLLNSLNIVYNLAEIRNIKLVQEMIIHLMNYFRFITRTQTALVKVQDEADHIEHYLQIQKMRFPNHLIFGIDIDPDMQSALIPSLIFQPIVENAIVHGLDFDQEPFRIQIRIAPEEDSCGTWLVILISDNGPGFPLEKLKALQDCEAFEENHEHLGIWNVRQRLKMHSQDQAKLIFANGEMKGAEVTLRIPAQFE